MRFNDDEEVNDMNSSRPTRLSQNGAALVVGLILLVVATIVTITSMRGGVVQERMTSNQNNKAISLMSAEAGASQFLELLSDRLGTDAWNQTELEGWLEDDELDTIITPIGDGQYFFENVVFNSTGVSLVSVGQAVSNGNTLSETRILVGFDASGGGGSGFDAPATISCIGGPCEISAGAGQGSDEGFGTISGFDHPAYDPDCGSSAECRRLKPVNSDDPDLLAVVPAIYLSDPLGSTVTKSGGGTHEPYHGLSPSGLNTSGQDEGNGVAWGPNDFPDDSEGNSTAPTMESLFGPDDPVHDVSSDGSQGLFVIDGQDIDLSGNEIFVGLIVVRNCGTFTMSGNPNVYGAIVIDASGCPDQRYEDAYCSKLKKNELCKYDPFAGNGTPAVRYSTEALRGINNGSGGGTGAGGSNNMTISGWREITY